MKATDFLAKRVPAAARVFLVSGAEEWLRGAVVDHVRQAFSDHELVRVDLDAAEEGAFALLLDDLRTKGLFGGDRLFLVEHADKGLSGKEKGLARFVEAGEAVHPVIFVGESLLAKKPPKAPPKTGLPAAVLAAKGVLVWCQPPFDRPFGNQPVERSPLSQWVVARARHHGLRMDVRSAYALHRAVGTALRVLDQSLAKLALECGEGAQIREETVEERLGQSRQTPLFEVADALAERRLPVVLERLPQLFSLGTTDAQGRTVHDATALSAMLLRTLTNKLVRIFEAAEALERGQRFEAWCEDTRVPAWGRDRLREQVELWRDAARRRSALSGVLECERALKSSGSRPRASLELLALECFQPVPAPSRRGPRSHGRAAGR